MTELKEISKKGGIVYLNTILGLFLGFGSKIVFTRILGASTYGNFIFFFSIISLFVVFTRVGLDVGLTVFIPKYKKDKRNSLITFSIIAPLTLSILIIILLIVFGENLLNKIYVNKSNKIIIILSPLLFFLTLQEISKSLLRAFKDVESASLYINIITPVLKIAIFLFIVLIYVKNINTLIITFYLSIAIVSILLFVKSKKYFSFFKLCKKFLYLYKDIIAYSFPLLLSSIVFLLVGKIDIFMIRYFLSDRYVGIYSVALTIGLISGNVISSVNSIFAPAISELLQKKNYEKVKELYSKTTLIMVIINSIFLLLFIHQKSNILAIFGSDFIEGGMVLVIIALGQLINVAVGSAGYMNILLGRPKTEFYISLVILIVNILANIILIPKYGIIGAAVSSAISITIANILRLTILYGSWKILPYNYRFIKYFGLYSLLFIFFHFFNIYFNNYILSLIINSSLIMVISGLVILFFFLTKKEQNDLLSYIKRRIRNAN